MKRVIKANIYTERADRNLKFIRLYADVLTRVVDAKDEGEVEMAMSNLGRIYSKIFKKDEAIKAVTEALDYAVSEYLIQSNANNRRPEVIKTIVDYLKGLGYDMTKMATPPRGADESYVIIPADECTFQDIKTVAAAIAHDFGIKPDTGVIGGSWTSYEFKMDGVSFRIGFEEDKDFDPSGKESSLQFYL